MMNFWPYSSFTANVNHVFLVAESMTTVCLCARAGVLLIEVNTVGILLIYINSQLDVLKPASYNS